MSAGRPATLRDEANLTRFIDRFQCVCDDCKDAPATTYLFVGSHGRRKLDLCEDCADERSERDSGSRRDVAMLGGDPSL